MRDWQQHIGEGLLVAVLLAVVVGNYVRPQLSGNLWFMVQTGNQLPTIAAYSLPYLKEVVFPYGKSVTIGTTEQKTLMFNASRAPDGTVAYLRKSKGTWQVFLSGAQGERVLTSSRTLKRDLVWSPDGLSLAFSEIEASSTAAAQRDPDAWSVVRILRSGDEIVVGQGIHPHALVGSETAALTSKGIVSLALGAYPVMLVRSPVTVYDTAFSVAPGGARLAWVNPADQSLQVFERSPANTYEPLLSKPSYAASSLLFSKDGTSLLVTRPNATVTNVLQVVLPTGAERRVSVLPLYATLSAWVTN